MQQIEPEAAFAEACQALGESIVRERFYTKIITQQSAALQELTGKSGEEVTDDPSDKSGGLQKNNGLSEPVT